MRPRGRLVAIAAGLLAVVVLVASWIAFERDLARQRARIAQGAAVADTGCGRIEYASVGGGAPVLIVHGAGGGFDQGLDFGARLVRAGFRVVAMSRFGYLGTPVPRDATPAAQADAHTCLLDALKIERAAVVGASAGAPSSMQLALRHPSRVAALILVVPAAYVPRPRDAPSMAEPVGTQLLFDTALRSDLVYWLASRTAPSVVTRALLATPPEVVASASAGERARVASIIEHIQPVSARRLGLLNDARITSNLARYELERIAAPTLVVSAADDLFGTWDGARYSADQIPGARFIGYPRGGHVLVGHDEELIAAIASFIAPR